MPLAQRHGQLCGDAPRASLRSTREVLVLDERRETPALRVLVLFCLLAIVALALHSDHAAPKRAVLRVGNNGCRFAIACSSDLG